MITAQIIRKRAAGEANGIGFPPVFPRSPSFAFPLPGENSQCVCINQVCWFMFRIPALGRQEAAIGGWPWSCVPGQSGLENDVLCVCVCGAGAHTVATVSPQEPWPHHARDFPQPLFPSQVSFFLLFLPWCSLTSTSFSFLLP